MSMTTGERIKLARETAGLNQAELAERLSVEPPTVSRWENGVNEPRPSQLIKLAKIVNRSVDWIKGIDESGNQDIEKRLADLEAMMIAQAPELSHIPKDILEALLRWNPKHWGIVRAVLQIAPSQKKLSKKDAG
jgi:transcriptional regulator with XRE-family HTH domain